MGAAEAAGVDVDGAEAPWTVALVPPGPCGVGSGGVGPGGVGPGGVGVVVGPGCDVGPGTIETSACV